MNERFQIRGDSKNPYHLSVGGVLLSQSNVYLIKKSGGIITLPSETIYSDETMIDTLIRGFIEEVGIEVKVTRFLGSLITYFTRPDEANIEKTTLYFLVEFNSNTEKRRAEDEIDDEILVLDIKNAIKKLKEQKNEESQILERVI